MCSKDCTLVNYLHTFACVAFRITCVVIARSDVNVVAYTNMWSFARSITGSTASLYSPATLRAATTPVGPFQPITF